MNTHKRVKSRDILCEVCGKNGQASYTLKENICDTCYCSSPSTRCVRCRQMRHGVSPETGLCPSCQRKPEGICARCSRKGVIFNQEAWLCHECERLRRKLLRAKENRRVKMICSVCGKVCSSSLISRAICKTCLNLERNGRATCIQCHKPKVIYVKSAHLCKQCYLDRLAPSRLRKYIENFIAPNPFTTMLFQLLASTIDWSNVTCATAHRFHAFGEFLQTHPFHEPLTWQTIEDTCTILPANQQRPKLIRGCLQKVAYLLATKGQMESRETYIAKRNASGLLKYVPLRLQALVECYTDWLWERKLTPATIRQHLAVLASFWIWCEQHNIQAPEQVSSELVTEFLLSLYWKWHCSRCQETIPFEPSNRQAPRLCTHCGAIGTLSQISWCTQSTVAHHRAALLGFFDWAKVNHLVVANPVQRRIPLPPKTIRHYPIEITKQLCSLSAPDIDPTEGLILYLIIVHACSSRELQHAQLPTVLPLTKAIPVPSLAECYYVVLSKVAPSRGRRSPGRPLTRLDFPSLAAPWLTPLLERFERQRQEIVKDTNNPYLFVVPGYAHRRTPVSDEFIRKLVKRASLHILGAPCNTRLLRQTAAVMLADTISAGILPWLGWNEQQAFVYAWAPREVIIPQTADDPTPTPGPTIFPSAQEWKQKSPSSQSEQRGE
jgi:hypothetical protein